jgi:hypothetical protein
MARFADAAGLPDYHTWHYLKHVSATQLLDAKADLTTDRRVCDRTKALRMLAMTA